MAAARGSPATLSQLATHARSRRAFLGGALVGLGAWAATALGRVGPVRAENETISVGGEYQDAESVTSILNQTNNSDVFAASSAAAGVAVHGFSVSSTGVLGQSFTGTGVLGVDQNGTAPATVGHGGSNYTGVLGFSSGLEADALPSPKAKTGVHGVANQDGHSVGVRGDSSAGHAIHGKTSTGYGGYFEGKVYTTTWYELTEISTPSSPTSNRARLFIRDNGSGKTQLCVKFANGSVKILATEG